MVHPLSSMRQKTSRSQSVNTLINELPTHKSLNCSRYLQSLCLYSQWSPQGYCPLPLLSQDGSCILSPSAGLEPEEHSRKTTVFYLYCAGEVSRSLREGAETVFELKAADVISGIHKNLTDAGFLAPMPT